MEPTMFSRLLTLAPVMMTVAGLTGCASPTVEETDTSDQEVSATADDQSPAFGTPERAAFMRAIHAALDPKLNGQKNEYVVSWLRSKSGFTFMRAEVRGKGRPIDWRRTSFAAEIESGLFDLNVDDDGTTHVFFSALGQETGGGAYVALDLSVAPTDLSFAGQHLEHVPQEIYPFFLEEPR